MGGSGGFQEDLRWISAGSILRDSSWSITESTRSLSFANESAAVHLLELGFFQQAADLGRRPAYLSSLRATWYRIGVAFKPCEGNSDEQILFPARLSCTASPRFSGAYFRARSARCRHYFVAPGTPGGQERVQNHGDQ